MAQKIPRTYRQVHQRRETVSLLVGALFATTLACQPSENSSVQDNGESTDVQPPTEPVEPTPQDCDAPEIPDAIPPGTLWFQITLDNAPQEGLRVQH